MSEPIPPEPTPEGPILDYRSADKSNKAPIGSAVAGAFFGVLAVLISVPLSFGLSEQIHVPVVVGALVMVAGEFSLLLLARSAIGKSLPIERRLRQRRFYIIGFVIGCGVGILLEGLCFAALSKI